MKTWFLQTHVAISRTVSQFDSSLTPAWTSPLQTNSRHVWVCSCVCHVTVITSRPPLLLQRQIYRHLWRAAAIKLHQGCWSGSNPEISKPALRDKPQRLWFYLRVIHAAIQRSQRITHQECWLQAFFFLKSFKTLSQANHVESEMTPRHVNKINNIRLFNGWNQHLGVLLSPQ